MSFHMDTVIFTVRYQDQLVAIGQPEIEDGFKLSGKDTWGPISCKLIVDDNDGLRYDFGRGIQSGTSLLFEENFSENGQLIQSPGLDNRLGVYVALKISETLENGLIVFSCWEEQGGGTVPFLTKFIYERYGIQQSLIADITWATEGVVPGKGAAVSLRDRFIPRKHYVDKIMNIVKNSSVPYQLEVEGSGSSDGREIQLSPYPVDWCFVGAAQQRPHSPEEKVHKQDIESMIALYKLLCREL